MPWKLDPRSFVAGGIASLAVAVLVGAGPATPVAPTEIGRYQIAASATDSTHEAFVIDTVTGEVWQRANYYTEKPDFFQPKSGATETAK